MPDEKRMAGWLQVVQSAVRAANFSQSTQLAEMGTSLLRGLGKVRQRRTEDGHLKMIAPRKLRSLTPHPFSPPYKHKLFLISVHFSLLVEGKVDYSLTKLHPIIAWSVFLENTDFMPDLYQNLLAILGARVWWWRWSLSLPRCFTSQVLCSWRSWVSTLRDMGIEPGSAVTFGFCTPLIYPLGYPFPTQALKKHQLLKFWANLWIWYTSSVYLSLFRSETTTETIN